MKKIVLLFVGLMLSLSCYAKPVDQDQLKQVNEYLSELVQAEFPVQGGLAKVLKADQDEVTGLLNSVKTKFAYSDIIDATVHIDLKTDVVFSLGGVAKVRKVLSSLGLEFSDEEFAEEIGFIKSFLSEASEKLKKVATTDKDLTAQVHYHEMKDSFGINLAVYPKKENNGGEFNLVSIAVIYQSLEDKLTLGFAFDGAAGSKKLLQIKTYLSNIFNSLLGKNRPAYEDTEGLVDSLFEVYDKVSDQLSKYIDEIF